MRDVLERVCGRTAHGDIYRACMPLSAAQCAWDFCQKRARLVAAGHPPPTTDIMPVLDRLVLEV